MFGLLLNRMNIAPLFVLGADLITGIDEEATGSLANEFSSLTKESITIGGGIYQIIILCCIIGALICSLIAAILAMWSKTGTEKNSYKTWIRDIFIGLMILSLLGAVITAIFQVGQGIWVSTNIYSVVATLERRTLF